MSDLQLTGAFTVTDRTRPLFDGRVKVPGVALTPYYDDIQVIFRKALNEGAFEIIEQSMGSHIVTTARGDSGYYGLPVFLSRAFRHGTLYVRKDAGIESPADLEGKAVGLPEYQQTAGMWMRGIIRDMYGVDTKKIAWRTGGLESPGGGERTALKLPPDLDVKGIGPDESLNGLVQAGKLDAIIAPRRPSIAGKDGALKPLFDNVREAEEDYYRATQFFPIMHVAAIRKDVADAHPELPAAITRAFIEAKAQASEELLLGNFLRVALPWVADHARDVKALMGPNPWRYGFAENRDELAAMTRYCAHDGLTERAIDPAELFHKSTLDIADKV